MRQDRRAIAPMALTLAAAMWLGAPDVHARQRRPIEAVAWMQGCWELSSPGRTVEEQWMAPRGGTMLGVGRTVRDGQLAEYELVLIRERGDGLSYEAHPSGQEPALFMSAALGERTIVFENLRHDFPQRVGYERKDAGRLVAFVEGLQDGQPRRLEFDYRKVPCAGD